MVIYPLIPHSGGMVPFIRYYRKVRSSICISQKPYNGKKEITLNIQHFKKKKDKKQKKTGSLFPQSAVISILMWSELENQKEKQDLSAFPSADRSVAERIAQDRSDLGHIGTGMNADHYYESTIPKTASGDPLGSAHTGAREPVTQI